MAPKEIPLKRKNRNNPQIKSYTDAIKRGQNNYHVFPTNQGWRVKQIGARDERTYNTQGEALSGARESARRSDSEIFIHNKKGLIEHRFYSSDPCPPRD